MNNNISNIFKIILQVIIIGGIIVLVAHLFVFLLPVILVFILFYYIYRIFFETKVKMKKNSNGKNIKNTIEEAEVVEEKFDK